MPKFQVLQYQGSSTKVTTAVHDARSCGVSPHYVRASATDPAMEWMAEVKAPLDLVTSLKGAGWSRVNLNPGVQKKPKAKKANHAGARTLPLNGVRGATYWRHIDELRLARAASGSKVAATDTRGEIRIILFSRRCARVDRLARCDNCGQEQNPVWSFKESTEGRVALCEWCKARLYERSHDASPNDAMYRAVYRKKSRG